MERARAKAAARDAEAEEAIAAAAAVITTEAGWADAVESVAGGRSGTSPAVDESPAAALEAIGVTPAAAADAAAAHTADVILGWVEHARAGPGVTNPAGLVLRRLRDGESPPCGPRRPAAASGGERPPATREAALAALGVLEPIVVVATARRFVPGEVGWPPAAWTDELVLRVWVATAGARARAKRAALGQAAAA